MDEYINYENFNYTSNCEEEEEEVPFKQNLMDSFGFPENQNGDNQSNHESQIDANDEQVDMHQMFPSNNPYPLTLNDISNTNSNNLHNDNQKSKSGTNPKFQKPRQRKKREVVILSIRAMQFRKNYHSLFGRKVNKPEIIKIHKMLKEKFGKCFPKLNRTVMRNIEKYYNEYVSIDFIILNAIAELIKDKKIDCNRNK